MLFDNTMKWVDSFVPMDTEVVEGSKSQSEGSKKRTREELESDNSKKQKIDENGRIVGIKRLHDDLGVNTAKVRVTAAKHNLVLLVILVKNMLSISAAGIKVNAAGYNC
ncbi:hypothetical protein Tco_0527016 [Tanacetum coccineum]